MKHILINFFKAIFRPSLKNIFVACHNFLEPVTEVPQIVQLVSNMELLAISSISEVRSEHNDYFRTSLRHTKGFLRSKKSLKNCDL